MWETKTFKTPRQMKAWVDRNGHCYQIEEIAVANSYGVSYRKLRVAY